MSDEEKEYTAFELHAEYYDLRRTVPIGQKTIAVNLPKEICDRYNITTGMTMRCIAGKGIFLILREEEYQADKKLRKKIEDFFREKETKIGF